MNIVFSQPPAATLNLVGTAGGRPNIVLTPAPGADMRIVATANTAVPLLTITPPPPAMDIVLTAQAPPLMTLVVGSLALNMTVAAPGTIIWGGGGGAGEWNAGTVNTVIGGTVNGGTLSIDAGSGVYANAAYPALTTIDDALDFLLYAPPAITSFSNDVGTVEIGSTVTAVTLNWHFNKAMVSVTLNGISVWPTLTTESLTGLHLTANTSWTLVASDGTNTTSANTGVGFLPKRWWGTSALASLTSSDILALAGGEFATSRGQSRSMSASAAYLYFTWPSSFGTPSFAVNGLPSTAWIKTTVSATNASGYTQNYDVWRSQYLQNGSGIAVVVS